MRIHGVRAPLRRNARPRHRARSVVLVVVLLGYLGMAPSNTAVALAADPTIAAAGDYGCDPGDPHYNGGAGVLHPDTCQEKLTSDQLVDRGYSAVLPLGDQHWCGSLAEYQQAYDPTWGRVKSISHPVPGNHDYITAGTTFPTVGCDTTNVGAAGYFAYFGAAAGAAGQGWYSYDVGAWHLIALNANCGEAGGCGPSSPQGAWLASDLAAHSNQCLLAYWHEPLFSSGGRATSSGLAFWQALYAAHADIVLNGHDHIYERFDLQNPAGASDPGGIREFIVGTGGANHTSIAAVAANSQIRDTTTFGILALTLHDHGYTWSFLPGLGSFTDSGSGTCHNSGSAPSPTPTPTLPSDGSKILSPIADAYVDNSHPTTNYGSNTKLRVDASPVVRSYLKFNVTALQGSVVSAQLRIYALSGQSTGYDVYAVADTGWSETAITDANAPPLGAKLGSSGRATTATWTQVTVTARVPASGTVTFGIATTNSTALALASRESMYGPELVVTTQSTGSTPTPTAVPTPTATPTPTAVPTPTAMRTQNPGARSFVATADSWVDASQPSINFGNSAQLRVDGSPVLRSYLKFTVGGTSGNVGRSVLWIYANSAQSTGFDVYSVPDTTWTEAGLTNANAPVFGPQLGSSGKVAVGTWLSVDVTSAVDGDGTFSLGLSTASATALSLGSRHGVKSPYLLVYPAA